MLTGLVISQAQQHYKWLTHSNNNSVRSVLLAIIPSHQSSALANEFDTVQFSSVQFAKINVVLSAKHFRTTTQ